ncbi:MAG: MFS transporter [Lentisphaeria bacterium]|nr:MFS transporter [Lentisphaeria bacterium]NLZ59320.1 multidrug efflux MFS transporter [Lentisphaerota bacterium]
MADDIKTYWKQNLFIMWVSQFVSNVGFSLSLPFAPFYLRSLGLADEGRVRAYAAMAAALSNLAFALMAPIWGVLADRYGRKNMVLRATFGGAMIVLLMGMARSPFWFVLLRCCQGLFTGTVSASMTLVASGTPARRQGFALGFLSTSVFSGDMTGLFLGGLLAEIFGYKRSFYLSSFVLGLSGLLVWIFAKEKFVPRLLQQGRRFWQGFSVDWYEWRRVLLPAMPLFTLYVFSTLARYLDNSQFPLFVEYLNGGPDSPNAPRLSSWVLGMGSVGAMLSGVVLGQWIDKYASRVARISMLGAAFFMALMFLTASLLSLPRTVFFGVSVAVPVLCLMPLRFFMIFFSAGLEPVWNTWLSKTTAAERKGLMFGLASSFRSLGAILAHSMAGLLACYTGILSIFVVGPLLFLLLLPMLAYNEKPILAKIKRLEKSS